MLSEKLDESQIHPDNLVHRLPPPDGYKFPKERMGRLLEVIYEKDGIVHSIPWKLLKKELHGNQICLVTPAGTVLSVIRKGQL